MSTVFIFGSNGFIGSNIAIKLATHGYKVYGQVRNASNASLLEKHEIIPVVADYTDVDSWLPYVKKSDVVIDVIKYSPKEQTILVETLKKVKKEDNPNLLAIYTSGIWMYGQQPGLFNEHSDRVKLEGFNLDQREIIEKEYINALNGVVVQPGCLYGLTGSYFAPHYKLVTEGKGTFTYYGSHSQVISDVHIHDLVNAYLLVIQKQGVARGNRFLVSSYHEKLTDILNAISKVSGVSIETYNFQPADKSNYGSIGLSLSSQADSTKIRNLLGWYPEHQSIVDGIERYYKSWKASYNPHAISNGH
ncbi:hypothetical protein DLAC_00835 [Tieghemostelium lacteum]|uniref:NAD(P)-binding domain-containing protein n=1 Tax=Tieghemostelium lacteum TaxID=361077 RepID=A0A152A729_TIELA|nr:hypothetical protein DLAC_00835 [Tieghemostelium lacteum]|eukprot:KYR02038.1 hypothetical protein DLAC_00835 [Tieghemostelium lacteum]